MAALVGTREEVAEANARGDRETWRGASRGKVRTAALRFPWVTVYQELIRSKALLIADTVAAIGQATGPVRADLEATYPITLQAEYDRLQGRAGFWRERSRVLGQPAC